jgi:dTDP-4-amino-4,6-dideoxygalactose transaminase
MSQLDRYAQALAMREEMAQAYFEVLKPLQLDTPRIAEQSVWFRFVVRMAGGLERVQAKFLERGVHVRRGVDELLHRICNLNDDAFPNAIKAFNSAVSLPIYPALTKAEREQCIKAAHDVFKLVSSQ